MRATLLMWKKMPMSVSWKMPHTDRMVQQRDSLGPHTGILTKKFTQMHNFSQ